MKYLLFFVAVALVACSPYETTMSMPELAVAPDGGTDARDGKDAHADGDARDASTPTGPMWPGWIGNPPVPTPTTGGQWWRDTDGVDPFTPGCHYAYNNEPECFEQEPGTPVVGNLQESCAGNVLVETNPEANVCHEHHNGQGHPDRFDCEALCIDLGWDWGMCEAVPNVCGTHPSGPYNLASARCVCGYMCDPNTYPPTTAEQRAVGVPAKACAEELVVRATTAVE